MKKNNKCFHKSQKIVPNKCLALLQEYNRNNKNETQYLKIKKKTIKIKIKILIN